MLHVTYCSDCKKPLFNREGEIVERCRTCKKRADYWEKELAKLKLQVEQAKAASDELAKATTKFSEEVASDPWEGAVSGLIHGVMFSVVGFCLCIGGGFLVFKFFQVLYAWL